MNHVLVIGSTGRIGREVVVQLQAKHATVRALTRNPSATRFLSGVEVVQGDLTSPDSLDAHLDDIDAVWTAPPATVATVLE